MKHTWLKHIDCDLPHCGICEGGLGYCTVCNCGEGTCPTECPGEPISVQTQERIYNGEIDFADGKWEERRRLSESS